MQNVAHTIGQFAPWHGTPKVSITWVQNARLGSALRRVIQTSQSVSPNA